MKNKLLSGAIFVLITTSVNAQNRDALQNSSPAKRAKMQTEWMRSKLSLNTSQTEKVKSLNLQYAERNEPILKSSENRLSKFKKLKASMEEKESALKKILNDGQYKKYQDLKAEMMEMMKEKRQKTNKTP